MTVVTATAEVDNLSIAAEVADNLNLEIYDIRYVGEGFTLVQICTGEAISPARLLANFWAEYADVSEIVSSHATSGLRFQTCGCLNDHVGACRFVRRS